MKVRLAARGFTLIELLVVISIIALLSSVVLTSLSVAREKTRDSVRKAQVVQFQKALQIYFTTYGSYPCAASGCTTSVVHFTGTSFVGAALIAANAISGIPSDPVYTDTGSCNSTGAGFCYCSNGGDSYVLTVNTEDDKGGSDRCYVQEGSRASTFCTGHQYAAGTIAEDSCTNRF